MSVAKLYKTYSPTCTIESIVLDIDSNNLKFLNFGMHGVAQLLCINEGNLSMGMVSKGIWNKFNVSDGGRCV